MSKFLPSRRELNIMLENGQVTSAEYRRLRKAIAKRAVAGGSAEASLVVTQSADILAVDDFWLRSLSSIFTEFFMGNGIKRYGSALFITVSNAADEPVGFSAVILPNPDTEGGARLIKSGSYGDVVEWMVRENELVDDSEVAACINQITASIINSHRLSIRESLWTDVMTGEDGGSSFDILAPRGDNPDGDSEMARI